MSIGVEIEGATATLTVDNPPANAWTMGDVAAFGAAISDLEALGTIRSLIVTGAGTKFFSAGADIRQFDHDSPEQAAASMEVFGTAFSVLARIPAVTIAAINGYALGGGLECALACDLRIVEEHAMLGLPETLVGLLPGGGGTQRLTRLVPQSWAKRMILLAERVDAQTAMRIGLADHVVSSGQASKAASQWSHRAVLPDPAAVRAAKPLIDVAPDISLEHGLALEREAFASLFGTPGQQEGVTAFLKKRPAVWKSVAEVGRTARR